MYIFKYLLSIMAFNEHVNIFLNRKDGYVDTRIKLFNLYNLINNNTTSIPILPSNKNVGVNRLVTKMMELNVPYDARQDSGLYYADKYETKKKSEFCMISGMTNNKFFDVSRISYYAIGTNTYKASEALHAFFRGPSMVDCGSAMNACVYQMILERLGTVIFDKIFGNQSSHFMISPINFQKFESHGQKLGQFWGNPLYGLFDEINIKNESELKNGDLVYIQGVKNYHNKHLAGYSSGWNLIVCKDDNNKASEVRYLGFSPDKFKNGPMTFKEINKLLIDGYNEKQNEETVRRIKEFSLIRFNINRTELDVDNYDRAVVADSFKNHTISDDYPIGGMRHVIRLNIQRVDDLINQFMDFGQEIQQPKNNVSNKIGIMSGKSIPIENINSTFENYVPKNHEQVVMLESAKKFADKIVASKKSNFNGFTINGNAGIGKTHLTMAIAKHALHNGLNVAFVDEIYIAEIFQISKGTKFDYNKMFEESDLIIMDDINSQFSVAFVEFLKQAMDHAIIKGKSIIFTSNHKLPITDLYSRIVSFNDPISKNFTVLGDLKCDSNRIQKTDNIIFNVNDHDLIKQKIYQMNQMGSDRDLSMIIVDKSLSLNNALFDGVLNKYVAREAYSHNRVNDVHIHDAQNYKTVIIKVTDSFGEVEQFLHLVSKQHDHGLNVIVITNDVDKLRKNILNKMDEHIDKDKKIRLTDRIRINYNGFIY